MPSQGEADDEGVSPLEPTPKRFKRAKRDNDATYMRYFESAPAGQDAKGKPVSFVKCIVCSEGT